MARFVQRRHFRWRDFSKPWPQAVLVRDILANTMRELGVNPDRERLAHLWECWPYVMGPELASMACPLGTHKDILLLGCEDNMLMQEVNLLQYEILERVNAFMEKDYFHDMRASLIMGRPNLATRSPQHQKTPDTPRTEVHGTYLDDVTPDTPWARCYAHYARRS